MLYHRRRHKEIRCAPTQLGLPILRAILVSEVAFYAKSQILFGFEKKSFSITFDAFRETKRRSEAFQWNDSTLYFLFFLFFQSHFQYSRLFRLILYTARARVTLSITVSPICISFSPSCAPVRFVIHSVTLCTVLQISNIHIRQISMHIII